MATAREPGAGHNNPPVNGDLDPKLVGLMERIDVVEAEIKALGEDRTDIYTEGKALGYDTKTMRETRKWWKMSQEDRVDKLARFDRYMRALGLDLI